MNTRFPGAHISKQLARLFAEGALNTCPVILKWREPASVDSAPAIETDSTPLGTDKTLTVNAFVHQVGQSSSGGDTTIRQRYTEVQKGDIIIDFPGDVALDGKPGLIFSIGGLDYVQKAVGAAVAASWDLRCSGKPITRTVCVQPL